MFLRLVSLMIWQAFVQEDRQAVADPQRVYKVTYSVASSFNWKNCKAIGPFVSLWSKHKDNTQFRAFYNEKYFVFRFDVEDSAIVDIGNTEESVTAGDRIELFFSRSPALADFYYCIEISPTGRVLDYRAKYYRQFDNSWKMEGLLVAAKRAGKGYSVKGQIPISFFTKLLDTDDIQGAKVYAAAFRAEMSPDRLPDNFTWFSWLHPNSPTPDFHIPSSFGIFQF